MVTVRTVSTPQTREAATPNVDIRTRASADDFGAGFGQSVVSASKSIGAIAAQKEEERRRQSFANTNAKLLELDEHAAETLRNPETGYLVSQGEDTLARYGETRDSFNKKSDELAGQIEDPEARAQFELKSRRRKITYDGSVNTKASTQRERLFNENHGALQRNELLRQADNFANPVAVDVGLHNRIQNEIEYMEHAGINPESEDGKLRVKAIMAESYGTVIETALNNDDPKTAEGYLNRKMITDALGVNATKDFRDRLTTGNHLLVAQEISTRGLSDPRSSDLGTINDVQIEGANLIREEMSGEAEKLALQQWHAGFETRKRLLKGQKNAFEENAIGSAMSKESFAEAMSEATIAGQKDPILGAKMSKMARRKFGEDVPNDKFSRSAFITVKSKAENGAYDELINDPHRLRAELTDAGLTFGMIDEITEFIKQPEKSPVTQTALLRKYRQMSGDPSIKQLPYEIERAVMDELNHVTGGSRKATDREVDAALGYFAIKGFGAGIGTFGGDDDNETQFELDQKGQGQSFTAYLTPADTVRITRNIERAFVNNPEDMPEITEELLQRTLTTEQTTGNTTAEQFEISRNMIDIGIDGNEDLAAQDQAVRRAIIQLGEDGNGTITESLTWQQDVDLIVYQANNESADWKAERVASYPADVNNATVKKLSKGVVWWSQVEGMMNRKTRGDGSYQLQLERLRAQKPSFAEGIEAGIKHIEGGRNTALPTGIVPQNANDGAQQGAFPNPSAGQATGSIFQPFNRR